MVFANSLIGCAQARTPDSAVYALSLSSSAQIHNQTHWIRSWQSSPAGLMALPKLGSRLVPPPPKVIKGTIRCRLHLSQGGSHIRLTFWNESGEQPLNIHAASVGLAGDGLDALPGSLKGITFGGKLAISVPAGAPVLSDPIDMPVKAQGDVIVSIYVPEGISVLPWNLKPSKIDSEAVDELDATRMERLPESKKTNSGRTGVAAVDVLTDRPLKVIVTLGDSITDGIVDPISGERGWPGVLSRRIYNRDFSVVNAGIGGNRLLQSLPGLGSSALARLDQDVFSVPGLSHIIVLEGINDIQMSGKEGVLGDSPLIKPEELIAAFCQIIARAHERGVKVIGATIMPFGGSTYHSEEGEQVRNTVNEWIRTSKAFDAVIDFDAAMRDPLHPDKIKMAYDFGDHLHPNVAGYQLMGEAINLNLFD